jgi:hypothetical protein
VSLRPYSDTAREAIEDCQDLADADYYTARSAYRHGDLRRAVGLQMSARINSAAARAAYHTWIER